MPDLLICKCPKHGFWSVAISTLWGSHRITPSKCCGTWKEVHRFHLNAPDWADVASIAEKAASEEDATE